MPVFDHVFFFSSFFLFQSAIVEFNCYGNTLDFRFIFLCWLLNVRMDGFFLKKNKCNCKKTKVLICIIKLSHFKQPYSDKTVNYRFDYNEKQQTE